jgi:hypothetical protein
VVIPALAADSVAGEPTFARDVPFDQVLEGFYDWYVTTVIQERLNIGFSSPFRG